MKKILISACLVGDKVRYDGGNNLTPTYKELLQNYELVPFCPEVEGGLSIPRVPSEIKKEKVFSKDGKDVTDYFIEGAKKALAICKYLHIEMAVLKDGSPSCGVHEIYDGSFQNKKISGQGITAQLLRENGIKVYSESEIPELLK